MLQRIKLQHAERRHRAHVVGPEQMHQRVGQFWKLVIEFLAQAPRKERKAFQQTLYIRILTGLCEKRSERRITLGELPPELSQRAEFALVITIEGHASGPRRAARQPRTGVLRAVVGEVALSNGLRGQRAWLGDHRVSVL